ncbi:DUF2058 domain-containing protein [Desulfosediminicola ganghwensis]|uniref:DUF2058 domain-containing protein n=1 Tax=Desulfosediminicola ganghwensis TaxID=2569540 RepID=UPI0010AC05C1|nr:DUF2058 domain-containing protein [Desulfosediminicola ganghwensis]
MGSSFQDQLLKLGLVDKKQVEKTKKKQHKSRKTKIAKNVQPKVDENKLLAEQALAKKKERARQLNQEREEKLKKREEAARIRQLIESSRLPKQEDGVAYRFVDRKKVFRIFISQELVDSLSRGGVGIVRLGDQYEVCPAKAVQKIAELDKSVVVMMNKPAPKGETEEDDPYAGYEVPDDLMW